MNTEEGVRFVSLYERAVNLARKKSVLLNLVYEEFDQSFYCYIDSMSDSDRFVGRDRLTPQEALEDAIRHMESL